LLFLFRLEFPEGSLLCFSLLLPLCQLLLVSLFLLSGLLLNLFQFGAFSGQALSFAA
jgi:hypothetical protein